MVEAASTSSENNSNQAVHVPKAVVRLPESPPPPYVTPPGSISRNFSVPGFAATSNTRERENDEEDEEELSRRDWFHQASDQPSSAVAPTASTETLDRLSFSLDVDLLGAYPRNHEDSSNQTADASCDPQRRISPAVSTDTPGSRDEEGVAAGEAAMETAESSRRLTFGEEPTDGERALETVVGRVSCIVKSLENVAGCSCEGACGCATVQRSSSFRERRITRLWPARCASVEQYVTEKLNAERERKEQQTRKKVSEEKEEEEGEDQADEEEDESSSFKSKSTIVRLLGARKRQHSGSGGSVASTTTSTPCGTLRRSVRKFSVYTRDGCFGRASASASAIRSINSYEKLSNSEFETIRGNLHASDPAMIAYGQRRVCARPYASCDLESLYESIKILDGFLARKGLVAHNRKQSVTVMLFGTPEHGAIRRRDAGNEEERIRGEIRVSRYSLDALSN